ncbi:MAG TPA: protein phosphatase 2C domain-containing protein, partial [Patescibacteria group bacterium]|nr:protein phosphatase 2C domain-containing protein [Patescibacteria group bacterium]
MPEKAPTAEQLNEEYGEALRQSVDEQAEQLERGYIDAVTQGSDETHPLHTDNVQALRGEVESDESLRAASEAQAEINRIENELSNPVLRASEKRDLQHQLDEWKQLKSSYDTAHQQTVEDFRDLLGAEAYHAAVDTVTKNYTDGFLTLAKNQKVKAEAEGKKQAEDQARADVEDALHGENPDEAKEGEHPKATSPIEEIADEELSAFQRILKNELDLRQDVVSHMIKIATEGEQAPEQAARIMDRLNALQTESPDEYERAVAEFDALEDQALEKYKLDHQAEVAQPEDDASEHEVEQVQAATAELLENFKLEIGQAERAVKGEDRILRNEELGLFGVIDGMGGEGGGDVAAQIIHDTIEAYVREAKESGRFADEGLVPILRQAVEECQDALQTAIDQGHGTRRMGAAGTFVLVEEHPVSGEFTLAFAHVGDTRLYVNSQALTEDEGVANHLRQAIVAGGYELDQLSYVTLMDGDRIVLCSDGITGDLEDEFLTDAEFADALSQPNAQLSAERFLALSKKHDDKSVLVIDVHEKNEVQPVWPQPDVEHGSLHDRLRQNASQAEPDQQPSVVEPVQERPSFEPGKFKTDTY